MIYLAGYSKRKPDQLRELAITLDAVVWDIRHVPFSRWQPQWNRHALQELLGERYRHVPSLGNLRYKDGPPVQLADWWAGLGLIEDAQGNIILLCSCYDKAGCHRAYIAQRLRRCGFEARSVEWSAEPTVRRASDSAPPADGCVLTEKIISAPLDMR